MHANAPIPPESASSRVPRATYLYARYGSRAVASVSAHIRAGFSNRCARDMCTHMLACRRARWMHSVAWKHVFTSRVVVTFRLGAVIAEARLENRPETMDRRQNFTKGRRGRAHRWRQQRECVHFGAADIDHPLFSVWFCCNIARTFVPDFRGIACNQRTDASEHGASFSLLFFTGLFFFYFGGIAVERLLVWRIRGAERRL